MLFLGVQLFIGSVVRATPATATAKYDKVDVHLAAARANANYVTGPAHCWLDGDVWRVISFRSNLANLLLNLASSKSGKSPSITMPKWALHHLGADSRDVEGALNIGIADDCRLWKASQG